MNPSSVIFVSTFFLLPLLLLLVALFLCIPRMLEAFQKLKRSHKASDFSQMFFWGATSLIFLTFVYLVSVKSSLDCLSHYSRGPIKFLIDLLLTLFTFCLIAPNIYHYWQRWEKTQKPIYFSIAVLLGVFSLYGLSVVCLGLFLSAIGVQNDL